MQEAMFCPVYWDSAVEQSERCEQLGHGEPLPTVCCQILSVLAICLQANARMQQVIQSWEAEANYTIMLDGVMRLVEDLNGELKQSGLL